MGNPHLSANSAEMESISKARFDENGAGHLGSYNVWQVSFQNSFTNNILKNTTSSIENK